MDFAVQGARGRSHTQPLTDLATLSSELHTSGYSTVRCVTVITNFILFISVFSEESNFPLPPFFLPQSTRTFSLQPLEHWMNCHLSLSPFGPHAMRSGARDKHCLCFRSDTLGRIATNTQTALSG